MKRKSLLFLLILAFGLPWAARAQKTLPYEYGFENYDLSAEGWSMGGFSFQLGIASGTGHSGDCYFQFYGTNDQYQYLVSPELSLTANGLLVEFYYKNNNTYYPQSFQVGYSTTDNGISHFEYGEEVVTASDAKWTFYSKVFPSNTKYISVRRNIESNYLYVDDFCFAEYSTSLAPKDLVLDSYTSTTATINWSGRAGQDHWDIYFTDGDEVPNSETAPLISNTDTKPYTINVASETPYKAYVRANFGENNYSAWSEALSFEVGCYTPTNFRVTNLTCNSARLQWNTGGNETSWQLVYSAQQGFNPDVATPEILTSRSKTISNLTTNTTYYARVRAVCDATANDYSPWTDELSFTPICKTPSALHASEVTLNSATLTWTKGSNETQWELSYSTTESFNPENGTKVTVNSNTYYTLNGLTLNTQYYAYVRAICGENIYSDWSNICAFMPKYELTVGNGANYNSFIPICTSAIDYTTKSQFIVPASDLTNLLYTNISKMTFYANSETGNMGAATFDVLISELNDVTAFENYEFFDWSEMTSVYSGSLSVSGSKMEIILTAPYQYMGGDLLIGFTETASGTGNSFGWYGAETTGYSAYGGYEMTAYSYTSYSRYKFMPKTTFSYTPGTAPTCMKPKNLSASNVGATSATLSWTNGDTETAWVLQYATDANFNQNVTSVNVTTKPYTLTNLTPETTYFARVKADCGGDDFSTWSNACSFTPSAIHTIVINDGTTTNTNVPFRSSIASTTNVKSQFIITSDVLENVAGNHITGLTFHTSEYYPTASYPGAVFKVYLSLTEMTEFQNTTPVDWNTLTEVYSGSLSISDNKMVVTLSAPYLYTGGNLLVAFDETTLCSSSGTIYWNGVSTNDYPALSYSGSYYRRQFLPKMTLTYNTAIAICSTPTNLSIETTSNTATLTWTAGDEETNWNVQYKAVSASDWSETIAVEDNPTCTINGLSATTEYQVRVQADCGSSVSSWITESFTTSCGSVSIPYSYDFSDVTIGANGAFPQCWTRINDSENSNYDYYPFVTANNKVLKFQASANANAPTNQIAVMPEIVENINTLRMSFNAYLSTGNSNKPLSIGVMTDPNDASTFTKVTDVVVRGTSSSVLYPISLEGYQGEGHYIAFKCDKLTSGSDYSIFIDNITVETVPTVAPVNIPYSYNFDNATTGYNAFPPDGWHFSNTYYPYVYESASLAHSGSNFLLMQKPSYESACYAALPAINTTESPINTLKLSFQARMWNPTIYSMYLSIGVMTDPSDISTFQMISSVSVRNDYTLHEIYFDDYAGEGQYIALRCYNTDNYFCVDDIEVSVAPTCRQPLDLSTQYTTAHEAEIRWETRDLRQCNYQVSYSTDETFNPEDGTIVDVEFENTLVNAGTDYRDYYLTCLNANTTYYYYVRANCGNGDFSEWSDDYASLTTGEPCPAPYDFYANTVKNTYAELRWYGDIESEWQFQYKKTPDDEWITPTEMEFLNGEGNEIIFRLSGLESGTDYDCRVREHCGMYSCPVVDDGYSDWAIVSFTTGTGCAEPQPWMCLTQMGTSATLEWYQTGEETRWQIRYRLSTEYEYPSENIVLTDAMPEARKQRWTITGLQTNSMYYWQVRAYCDSENQSEWSEESYFFTGGDKITVDKNHSFFEDFEGTSGMPDGWMRCNQYNYDLDYYMPWSYTPAEGPSWDERPGNHGIYNNSDDYHGSTSVLTPEMHIDENAYSAKLSFWDYCDYGPSAISGQNISYGSMQIMASTNHGETYDDLWWSFGPKHYWHQFFVDLDEYIGKDIIIRFDYWWANNNPNFDWYIDDVKVQVFDNAFGSGSDITSGDWNDASMWGNGTPDGNDDVIINANVNIPDGVVAEANQIVINTDTINTGGKAQKFGKLTITDGGQLKVRNSVEATLQKTITASEAKTSNAWYAISSPVNNIAIEDFVQGTHNVYQYDEPSMMWQEYRNDDNNFENLTNGRGYLYRSTAASLEFTGDINVGEISCPLSYASTDNRFKGFNLIGNPYPHSIYKGANASIPNTLLEDGFYTLTESGAWNAGTDNSTAIKPNTGILVQAKSNANGQDLIFTDTDHQGPSAKSGDDNIIFTVKNSVYSDVAYVLFKEGRGLNKIEHRNADIQMLYVINDGEDFAIADMNDNTKLINLGFEAKTMGQYTISVKAEGEFSYMHLVDKLTGDDTDMLMENSYTFVGTPGDRLDRFVLRLDYNAGHSTDSETFAYQSGSDIIVSGDGTLEVYDVLGRLVSTQRVSGVQTIAAPQMGVYIFKLNGKTQKMIIR